jgi:hypothetical protein
MPRRQELIEINVQHIEKKEKVAFLRINRQKRENSERKPTAVTVVSAIPGSFI